MPPNWLPLTFAVGDGPWLGQGHTEVLSDRRDLDLRGRRDHPGDRQVLLQHGRLRLRAGPVCHPRSRGPRRVHTGYPDSPHAGIDNNAYTKVMTSWLLLHATAVLDVLPANRRRELTDRLGITAAELQRWDHISRRIYVPFHSDGIISQFGL
jgi:Glycosyl hydrolase family 65 central catalytic domain